MLNVYDLSVSQNKLNLLNNETMDITFKVDTSGFYNCFIDLFIDDSGAYNCVESGGGTHWYHINLKDISSGKYSEKWNGKGSPNCQSGATIFVPTGTYTVNVFLNGYTTPNDPTSINSYMQFCAISVNGIENMGNVSKVSAKPISFTPNGTSSIDISYKIELPGSLDIANVSLIIAGPHNTGIPFTQWVYYIAPVQGWVPNGKFSAEYVDKWNGKDNSGKIVPQGKYYAYVRMLGTDSGLDYYYLSVAETTFTIV
jgi:hypothetical protein